MEEGDPLALPFIKCEAQGNLHGFGGTEDNIFISEFPDSSDNVNIEIETGNFTESQLSENNGIDAVDYSTDTASEVSNVEEDFTNLSQKPITDKNTSGNYFQNYNEDISQNNVVRKWKPTPSQSAHFVCNICSKIVKGKCALKSHIITHSDERPFSCKTCNKTFARKRILKEHELVHTGERPFTCDICNKSFAKKSTLIKHSVVHTGDRKHCCDICDKRFAQRSGLMKHRATHTGERPFSCNYCDKAFTVRSGLKRHAEKCHPDKTENSQSEKNILQ